MLCFILRQALISGSTSITQSHIFDITRSNSFPYISSQKLESRRDRIPCKPSNHIRPREYPTKISLSFVNHVDVLNSTQHRHPPTAYYPSSNLPLPPLFLPLHPFTSPSPSQIPPPPPDPLLPGHHLRHPRRSLFTCKWDRLWMVDEWGHGEWSAGG